MEVIIRIGIKIMINLTLCHWQKLSNNSRFRCLAFYLFIQVIIKNIIIKNQKIDTEEIYSIGRMMFLNKHYY